MKNKKEAPITPPVSRALILSAGWLCVVWTPNFSFALHSYFLMITWPGDQRVRVQHLSDTVCLFMSWAHVRAWHQQCGHDGFSLQYPAVPSIQHPDVQSRLVGQNSPDVARKKKKIIFHRVHEFLWCPEDQAARWDDLRYVVAVQLLRLHQHQLPLHHHCLQFHNQFTCNILPLSNTEPTIASDVKILWIFYQTFVHIKLVQ